MSAADILDLLCTPGVRVLIMDLDTSLMQQVMDATHESSCPLRLIITVKTLGSEKIMTFKRDE